MTEPTGPRPQPSGSPGTGRRRRPVVAPATRVLTAGSAVAATLLLVGAMATGGADTTVPEPSVSLPASRPAVAAPQVLGRDAGPSTTPSGSSAPPTVVLAVPAPASAPVPVTASHGSR